MNYDKFINSWDVHIGVERTDMLTKLVNRSGTQMVLDVGCGTGNITSLYVGAVIGCDIAQAVCAKAKAKVRRVVAADSNVGLPFDNNSFDVVVCSQTIEHVLNTEVLIEEIYRVLRFGGIAIINTPNMNAWYNRIAVPFGFQPFYTDVANKRIYGNRFKISIYKNIDFAGHIRVMNYWALKELLENQGFTILKYAGSTSFRNKLFRIIDRVFSVIYPRLASDMIMVGEK